MHPTGKDCERSWPRQDARRVMAAGKKRSAKALDVLREGVAREDTVVLLSGEDEYLHELLLKRLESDRVDADFRDFNYRKVECARSTDAGTLDAVLSELPTLVDERMVVLSRLSQLDRSVSTQMARTWTESLAPGTLLVVTAGGPLKDNLFWTDLAKRGVQVDCSLTESEIDSILNYFSRKQNRKVDKAAFVTLKERAGLDLRALLSHVERCLLSLKEGETLTAERVTELVPFSAEVAMWKMTKAIGDRNHREALAILDKQLERGEPAGSILRYLNMYLSSLVQIGGLMKQLNSPVEVARAIPRKTEFQVKKSVEELRTWSTRDLEEGFEVLARADYKSKGGEGGADPKLLLQMAILKLCSRKRR